MATTQQILDREFNLLKVDLIKAYDAKGMRASGKSAESLEVTTTTNSSKLTGDSTWGALEGGRSPSTNGSKPGKLIDQIKQWIIDKGIVSDIKNDQDNSSLAFLITRKIHRDGWDRRNHGGINVVSEVVTEKRIQRIIDMVGAQLTLTLIKRMGDELKQIAV